MKEFRIILSDQTQIYLSFPNIVMPKIYRKIRQCRYNVAFLFLKLLHTPDSEGMSQVMDSGTIPTTFVFDSAMPQAKDRQSE